MDRPSSKPPASKAGKATAGSSAEGTSEPPSMHGTPLRPAAQQAGSTTGAHKEANPGADAREREDFGLDRGLESPRRIMERDGSMTVERLHERSHLFHDLLAMSWPRFLLAVLGVYVALNTGFAIVYMIVGLEQLSQVPGDGFWPRFGVAFHFSAQTLTTVGYGFFSPQGPWASAIATFEALVGLLSFALATGLVYGRFATPRSGIAFAEKAVVAPLLNTDVPENGDESQAPGWSLQVALANKEASELVEVEARMMLAINEVVGNQRKRTFHELDLERNQIYFLTMNWNLVHRMDATSPLGHCTAQDLRRQDVEVIVLVKAFNRDFSQWVHARRSYTAEEIEWGSRYAIPYEIRDNGETVFDLKRLGKTLPNV